MFLIELYSTNQHSKVELELILLCRSSCRPAFTVSMFAEEAGNLNLIRSGELAVLEIRALTGYIYISDFVSKVAVYVASTE